MSYTAYTIEYQYGTYSGTRTITLEANDERDPIEVMWSRLEREGALTLGMAYQSARIVRTRDVEED